MDEPKRGGFAELRRAAKEHGWRHALLLVLSAWNRHQMARIGVALVAVWLVGGTAMHLAEGGQNENFDEWGESYWNVVVVLFSGLQVKVVTPAGRVVAVGVAVAGLALVGLFTASIASILVERSLRKPEVSSLEMSDHLVLCNWSSRGLEWVREVHSSIVADKRPVVIIHDNPDEVELPDKVDDPAFTDVYIVKGDPANEVILRRAKVQQAHSVVILSDERQGPHADGKTVVCCIAAKAVCRGAKVPNVVAECRDPKYRPHMRKAGADEVISANEFGVRLIARAALFPGMIRVYQELLTVGRDANEMYLMPIPPGLVGKKFVETAGLFLTDRANPHACLLIGVYRGERLMLNPVGGEAGPLRAGDELILLSPVPPDLSKYAAAEDAADAPAELPAKPA